MSLKSSIARTSWFSPSKLAFIGFTILWIILFIVVAAENSKCTVCDKDGTECSSSVWRSSASEDAAMRLTLTVGDSGDYDIRGCNWTAIQVCSLGTLVFFALSMVAGCLCCSASCRSASGGQESPLHPYEAPKATPHALHRTNPHFSGPFDAADSEAISIASSARMQPLR